MKVSDIVVQSLEDQGIEYVFGVPGEENADFVQSLEQSDTITFVLTHDETAAGMMAIGYAQVSGKPAVCLSTLGPGLTNMATAMGQALQDGVPMIAIVGQGSTERVSRDSHQIIDQIAFAAPITKRALSLRNAHMVSQKVKHLVKVAISGKPGTVMLEIPENIAKMDGLYHHMKKESKIIQYADFSEIAEAADVIAHSLKPLILIGAGVHREGATEAVRNLLKSRSFEVANTFQGKGVAGNNTVGFMDGFNKNLIDIAELVITIGYGQVEVAAEKLGLDGKKVINICIEPHSDDPFFHPDMELIGDMTTTINRLTQEIENA